MMSSDRPPLGLPPMPLDEWDSYIPEPDLNDSDEDLDITCPYCGDEMAYIGRTDGYDCDDPIPNEGVVFL